MKRQQPTRIVHRLASRGGRISSAVAIAVLLTVGVVAAGSRAHAATAFYQQTNLVSDQSGVAAHTDSHLINPWGISSSSSSPFWVSDNGTGVSTLYNSTGQPLPLVVTISGPVSDTTAPPTGQVFNSTSGFTVTQGITASKSLFIFATISGTVDGWSPSVDATHAIVAVDNSSAHAVYTGLALASTGGGNYLYAANFAAGTIDVFDQSFKPATLAGSFYDPNLPAGYVPFNIQNIGGKLYVAYALFDPTTHMDAKGPGHGVVDVFDTDGTFLQRLVSNGATSPLNSPWGLALAPSTFGPFGGDLLVGNFGDGRINAFDPATGAYKGTLMDKNGAPIAIDGLWGLIFGNGGNGGDPKVLYFAAGPNGGTHGLFGSLTSMTTSGPPPTTPELGSGELLVTGLVPLGLVLLYRRRRARSRP